MYLVRVRATLTLTRTQTLTLTLTQTLTLIRYMSRADPLIITHVPQISRLWAMARSFLSDDLRRRLVVIPSDSQLVSVLG